MFRLVQACKTGGFLVFVESLKRVQTEDETAFCFGSSSLFLALRPTCNSVRVHTKIRFSSGVMSPLLSSISCTTSPTFPFVLAFSNPKTRLAANRYMHCLHLAIANQSEHCPPSFRSEMHGSRPRRMCSSCLKTRVSTCTCVLIPNGPSSHGSSQPHSKSGAAEREVLRDLLARA
jgi:hypothetical protein